MTGRPLLPQALRFSRFELQPLERRLLVDGQAVPLGARAFDLLLALASRPGQLLTKNALLDEVWPGLVVEEANLSVQVSTLRKVLGGDLIATIPGRGYRFTGRVDVVSSGAPAAERVVERQASAVGLPVAPSLIGRDDDLARLRQALAAPGCVTLVGPAGVGKTTLARALAAHSPAGAVWVDLAPLTAADQVAAAAARALGTSGPEAQRADRLCARLGARLLVLDNGEHVVDAAAALVSQLLQADPGVHVLATSQLRLAVAGERVHRLEPLALPLDSDALDLHRGAVALFVERARAADHRFEATPAKLPLLRQICRRLDGLPLALEMAAARVPVLGLGGLAQALERRFALLTGGHRDAAGRHRTLQAALDWSHGLLSADEQRLYRLCGVFAGGFTLELLVDVAAGGADEQRWAVIDTLSQLVDRSLVAVDDSDPPRYRLLETMRDDAARRLRDAGEERDARVRLLAALAALGHRAGDSRSALHAGREQLLAEHDNLREAIAWGRLQPEPALRADTVALASATALASLFSAWRLEALQWLESCEPLAEGPDMAPPLRTGWWYARARQWMASQHDDAPRMAERALELARQAGDARAEFFALSTLLRAKARSEDELPALCDALRALAARHPDWQADGGLMLELAGAEAVVMHRLRDKEGMLRCRLRELELARRFGHAHAALAAETNLVFALQALGRHDEALQRARELTARLGDSDTGNAAYAWTGLFVSLQTLGHFDEFRAVLPRAARVLRLHGLPLLGPQCALVLAAEGRTVDALRVLGHARARLAARGMRMTSEELSGLGALEERARDERGDSAVDLCLAEGATLDEAAVDALMLGPAGTAHSGAAGRSAPGVPG